MAEPSKPQKGNDHLGCRSLRDFIVGSAGFGKRCDCFAQDACSLCQQFPLLTRYINNLYSQADRCVQQSTAVTKLVDEGVTDKKAEFATRNKNAVVHQRTTGPESIEKDNDKLLSMKQQAGKCRAAMEYTAMNHSLDRNHPASHSAYFPLKSSYQRAPVRELGTYQEVDQVQGILTEYNIPIGACDNFDGDDGSPEKSLPEDSVVCTTATVMQDTDSSSIGSANALDTIESTLSRSGQRANELRRQSDLCEASEDNNQDDDGEDRPRASTPTSKRMLT